MAEIDKPSNQEQEYFAREEIEKKRKLAIKQAQELERKQKQELKALHYMKCPKCGMDLQTLKKGPVEVDTCFNCHGVWLDKGELAQLVGHEMQHDKGGIAKALVNIFRTK